MSGQVLTAALLQGGGSSLHGGRYAIAGMLVVGESANLELADGHCPVRLAIHDAELAGRLLDHVPCHMGGAYLYHDPVRLVAILAAGTDGCVAIAQVESGMLERDGRLFPF
ncbi:hypothetical protein [Janthinobacterium sp. RT4P48]|uniref:hypothetical protein n=1 Tax=Janthinobacterium sp. RT4P48 TaxID=3424188 RepID=UPI003F24B824